MARWARLAEVERGLARWSPLAALGAAVGCSLAEESRAVHAESCVLGTLPPERDCTGRPCHGRESVHRGRGPEGEEEKHLKWDAPPKISPSSRRGKAPETMRGPGAGVSTHSLNLVHCTWHSPAQKEPVHDSRTQGSTVQDSRTQGSTVLDSRTQGLTAQDYPAQLRREGLTFCSAADRRTPVAAPPAQGDREIPGAPFPPPATSPAPPQVIPSQTAPGGPDARDGGLGAGDRGVRSPSPSSLSPVPAGTGASLASAAEARDYVRKKAQGWDLARTGPLPAVSAAAKGDQVRGDRQ